MEQWALKMGHLCPKFTLPLTLPCLIPIKTELKLSEDIRSQLHHFQSPLTNCEWQDPSSAPFPSYGLNSGLVYFFFFRFHWHKKKQSNSLLCPSPNLPHSRKACLQGDYYFLKICKCFSESLSFNLKFGMKYSMKQHHQLFNNTTKQQFPICSYRVTVHKHVRHRCARGIS